MANINAAQGGVGVDIHGHEHGGEDEEHLHGLTNAQPDDGQWNQRQGGHGTLDLHNAINQGFARTGQAGSQCQHHAGEHAQQQARVGACGRGQQMGHERAVAQHFIANGQCLRRGGECFGREPACVGCDFPDQKQQHRAEHEQGCRRTGRHQCGRSAYCGGRYSRRSRVQT